MAARVVLYIAQSLDGRIAAADGGVDWLSAYPAEDYGYDAFVASVGTLVMGRRTYDQMLGFGAWPHGSRRTVVVTSSSLAADAPAGVEAFAGDLGALGARLRAGDKDVWLVGGARLAQAFLARGLIDRIELFVIPLVLGGGVRLFDGVDRGITLRLAETTPFASGVVRLAYDMARGSPDKA